MEKTARKPSADPAQERLRANKAAWNKEVSAFINDLIHFKKMMNGWPSKFFKERSRITQPIPADPATIIGSLAGDFQELAQKGNGLIQQQIDYAKNRRQRQPKPAGPTTTPEQPPTAPATEAPKTPDLSQQLSKGLVAASFGEDGLIKFAELLEDKYLLESQASNPFSRFIAKLFNPKFGVGEGARIRRLRMTMLDNCVKTLKAVKVLQKEIVKSSSESIESSHKLMTLVWNHWNIVNRLFSTFKMIKPGKVKEQGGPIEDEELKSLREEGQEPETPPPSPSPEKMDAVSKMISDYRSSVSFLSSDPEIVRRLQSLNSIIEKIVAAPKSHVNSVIQSLDLVGQYQEAINLVNREWGTSGSSFADIVRQRKVMPQTKSAQARYLRKLRHELLPGATSGSRLEVYKLVTQIRKDLDQVMNLLEKGFDQQQLTIAVGQVNREMALMRTMMRSLYYSEKPEKASSPFF